MKYINNHFYDLQKKTDLIFDVGMHMGEDTDYYLKKGFRVVGFEANPDLIKYCSERFCNAIKDNKLIIIEGAIVDDDYLKSGCKTITFYKNNDITFFGSVDSSWAFTHSENYKITKIEVPVVSFDTCLENFGIPYYMKIDIEGLDYVCLNFLSKYLNRPSYVSIESEILDISKLQNEIDILYNLGYIEFKAIQQSTIDKQVLHNPPGEGIYVNHQFEPGSSGAFGNDLNGKWKSYDEILKEFENIINHRKRFGNDTFLCRTQFRRQIVWCLLNAFGSAAPGWYDTHARHKSFYED